LIALVSAPTSSSVITRSVADACRDPAQRAPQMSFTSAITIPAVTKTMIAICIQIQVGDTRATRR
jgi:hypothetical protein